MISIETIRFVRARANEICEYCRVGQCDVPLTFHVEHIIPRVHGGIDDPSNLALACPQCNFRKGTNLTGIDPDSGLVTHLFNPRKDAWGDHFELKRGRIGPRTAEGRTTVWVLDMNESRRVRVRATYPASQ
jgi:hypothetical protein